MINLCRFFLEHYESVKHVYFSKMRTLTGTVFSIDHTFKVSKHVGIVRRDQAHVKQFENCLFVMNEYGEILAWRLTKSTAFNEIQDLLVDLKQRHTDKGCNIEVIMLDDCCKMRRLYQGVFDETVVKLDVFHACQRVIVTLDDNNIKSQFGKEFGLIFRNDGDVDEERQQVTPTPEIIIGNLEQFLDRWQGKLSARTIKAIDDLKKHINAGCLSGILPGEGTERNERLHRHLRRSLLVGANSISPELAIACLTVAIYVWNCRRKQQKHYKNQRVYPIVPPECLFESSNMTDSFVPLRSDSIARPVPNCFIPENKDQQQIFLDSESPEDQIGVNLNIANATSVEDLNNDEAFSYIIRRSLQLRDSFKSINNQCCNRAIKFGSFPLYGLQQYAKLIRTSSGKSACEDSHSNIDSGKNMETLVRNLKSFNLTIDGVAGDGNCCFHSIALQLSKMLSLNDGNTTDANMQNYVEMLKNMGFGKSMPEDATLLRNLFIRELLSNVEQYKNWIDLEEQQFLQEIDYLQQQGTFGSNLADLCVKVCSNVLGLPIVVITSYPSAPHFSFFPVQMNYSNPIYIAFNHTSPGHYDGTKGLNFTFCYYLKRIPYIVKQWFPALHLSFYHRGTNLKVANH